MQLSQIDFVVYRFSWQYASLDLHDPNKVFFPSSYQSFPNVFDWKVSSLSHPLPSAHALIGLRGNRSVTSIKRPNPPFLPVRTWWKRSCIDCFSSLPLLNLVTHVSQWINSNTSVTLRGPPSWCYTGVAISDSTFLETSNVPVIAAKNTESFVLL